jgi:hypothetical protein
MAGITDIPLEFVKPDDTLWRGMWLSLGGVRVRRVIHALTKMLQYGFIKNPSVNQEPKNIFSSTIHRFEFFDKPVKSD